MPRKPISPAGRARRRLEPVTVSAIVALLDGFQTNERITWERLPLWQ
jgi:hypothetical protein